MVLQAIKKNGAVLGDFPLRVLPSKTAIVPVNNQYLPKNSTEREQCSRTIYAANIDKKVDRECVKLFFETLCGRHSSASDGNLMQVLLILSLKDVDSVARACG